MIKISDLKLAADFYCQLNQNNGSEINLNSFYNKWDRRVYSFQKDVIDPLEVDLEKFNEFFFKIQTLDLDQTDNKTLIDLLSELGKILANLANELERFAALDVEISNTLPEEMVPNLEEKDTAEERRDKLREIILDNYSQDIAGTFGYTLFEKNFFDVELIEALIEQVRTYQKFETHDPEMKWLLNWLCFHTGEQFYSYFEDSIGSKMENYSPELEEKWETIWLPQLKTLIGRFD